MQETIDKKDWANHPFLSKLTVRSDYDGDAAFTIKNPTSEDFVVAEKVSLEYSINGGEWVRAAFADVTPFIDEMSMGWYFKDSYHPAFELYADQKGKQVHRWRAVITK